MKNWIKRTFISLFSATLLVGGLSACAGHRGHDGMARMSDEDYGKMRGRMVERAGQALNLDATQKQRLTVLADKLREQRDALLGNGGDPRAEFQALVAGPTFDRNRAQVLIEAKTNAVRLKSPEVIAAAADFYDSLNAEQQQKVRDFMTKRHGRGAPKG